MLDASNKERLDALLGAEKWQDAIDLLDTLSDQQSETDWLWNYGWAHYKLGSLDRALQYLSKANEQDPDFYAACWAIGVVHDESGARDLAERFLLRALALRDTDVHRTTLAMFYAAQGEFELSESIHREGLRLRPRAPRRLQAYADLLTDIGRVEEADELYERASEVE